MNTRAPLISVITPVFNAASAIERTLLSVINQRYTSVEHVIIDGGSRDGTLNVIRDYQQNFSHIRLFTGKDEGLYDAINKGLDRVQGDWIHILGAGDTFHDEFVLMNLHEAGCFSEEQVVYGNVLIQGDTPWAKDQTVYDGPFNLEKLLTKNICHQAIFYPRSTVSRLGYYDPSYTITSDWDYNVRCFAAYRFFFTDRVIAIFHGGGKSSGVDEKSFATDLPEKVVRYFNLDVEDKQYSRPESPFFYPVMKYRGEVSEKKIRDARAEIAGLRERLARAEEEVRVLQKNNGKATGEAELLRKRNEHLNRAITEKEEHLRDLIANRERTIERLRNELDAHKRTIESLTHSYTWKTGRMATAPLRWIRSLRKPGEVPDGIK